MGQGFGNEVPGRHVQPLHRAAAKYLVVLSSGGYSVARLFLDSRIQVAEFDASTEETASMTTGLIATKDAVGSEWDIALAGHSAEERQEAHVYTLNI